MDGALFEVPGHIVPTILVGPLQTERLSFLFSGFRNHGNIFLILDCNPLLHLSKGNWTKIFIHLLCKYYGLCNWLKQPPSYQRKTSQRSGEFFQKVVVVGFQKGQFMIWSLSHRYASLRSLNMEMPSATAFTGILGP
jgi:hypothetical protein